MGAHSGCPRALMAWCKSWVPGGRAREATTARNGQAEPPLQSWSSLALELDSWHAKGGEEAEETQSAWIKMLSLVANAAVISTAPVPWRRI